MHEKYGIADDLLVTSKIGLWARTLEIEYYLLVKADKKVEIPSIPMSYDKRHHYIYMEHYMISESAIVAAC